MYSPYFCYTYVVFSHYRLSWLIELMTFIGTHPGVMTWRAMAFRSNRSAPDSTTLKSVVVLFYIVSLLDVKLRLTFSLVWCESSSFRRNWKLLFVSRGVIQFVPQALGMNRDTVFHGASLTLSHWKDMHSFSYSVIFPLFITINVKN